MREVFSNQDLTLVAYYKGMLDDAGISSYIRNENTNNPDVAGAGFSPTLCVISDVDFDAAIKLLKSTSRQASSQADWTCPSCSEVNPGNFELCWNCGGPPPHSPSA